MSTSPTSQVVIGAGAVGSGVAHRLADAGHHVRVVTRSGSGPVRDGIELIAADATDGTLVGHIAEGAHSVFNCANPPYSKWASLWPPLQAGLIRASEISGAGLVTMGNLYGAAADSSPMRATDPLDPPSRKGAIRARMWADASEAHRAGRIRTTEVRASDFFGPGLGATAHLGDRVVPRLLAGKSISMVGRVDQPHSWSYIGDVCDTLVTVALDDRSYGRAWHVPTIEPRTAQEMADAISDHAGVDRRPVKRLPTAALRVAGIFSADVREIPEMLYQFDRPFVIDATETTETFGLEATPLDAQVAATVASYRSASTSMESVG